MAGDEVPLKQSKNIRPFDDYKSGTTEVEEEGGTTWFYTAQIQDNVLTVLGNFTKFFFPILNLGSQTKQINFTTLLDYAL